MCFVYVGNMSIMEKKVFYSPFFLRMIMAETRGIESNTKCRPHGE